MLFLEAVTFQKPNGILAVTGADLETNGVDGFSAPHYIRGDGDPGVLPPPRNFVKSQMPVPCFNPLEAPKLLFIIM